MTSGGEAQSAGTSLTTDPLNPFALLRNLLPSATLSPDLISWRPVPSPALVTQQHYSS